MQKQPYRDILIFVITLLVANYAWKWTFSGDENGDVVTWLGYDVTAPFEWMACHIARVVYAMVGWFRDTAYMPDGRTVRFATGSGSCIIWGCTGIKQGFIWLWLILTVMPEVSSEKSAVRRLWLHKLWYIPVGWVCCYAFNILRIFLITLCMEHHPDWFGVLHDYIFKYAFYAMLFGLWVIFVEKIRPRA